MGLGSSLGLLLMGFFTGTYGTLIGAGGGFVLLPALLLLYPQETPEILTSISLAVVFFNALSGTEAYAMMGRVDYKSGLLFSAASLPGAVTDALTTSFIPRWLFDTDNAISYVITFEIYSLLSPFIRDCGNNSMEKIAVSGLSAKPIRDRHSQST